MPSLWAAANTSRARLQRQVSGTAVGPCVARPMLDDTASGAPALCGWGFRQYHAAAVGGEAHGPGI